MEEIPPPSPLPATRTLLRSALAALILLACTAGFVWLSAWGVYHRHSVILGIIGCSLATLTLALAMAALDRPLVRCTLPFSARLLLQTNKRVLLVAQLITTGMAVGMGLVLAFHFKIPGM